MLKLTLLYSKPDILEQIVMAFVFSFSLPKCHRRFKVAFLCVCGTCFSITSNNKKKCWFPLIDFITELRVDFCFEKHFLRHNYYICTFYINDQVDWLKYSRTYLYRSSNMCYFLRVMICNLIAQKLEKRNEKPPTLNIIEIFNDGENFLKNFSMTFYYR